MNEVHVNFQYAAPAKPLVQKRKRYKFWFGGRGRGASESVARYLIERALYSRVKIWCAKVIQESIADSVYSIIEKNIRKHELGFFFRFTDSGIICLKNQSEFIFKGMNINGNELVSAQKLKSYDDVDIVWVDEAQMILSKEVFNVLDPTVRKDGSELIFTFNPVTENDAVWEWGCKKQLSGIDIYRKKYHETQDSMFIYSTFEDNIFFPEALEISRKKCLQEKADEYDHLWLGYPAKTGDYKSFFEPSLINAACQRTLRREDWENFPKIMGFDPSEGGDTAEVCKRQGLKCFGFYSYRIKDPLELANRFAIHLREERPQAAFCDAGYGQAVIAVCKGQLGFNITGVKFGSSPANQLYANKRAEMYGALKDWLYQGGALPDDPILRQELNAVEIDTRKSDGGIIKLASKDVIRKKIGRSPGRADALALTFAYPVSLRTEKLDDYYESGRQINFGLREEDWF